MYNCQLEYSSSIHCAQLNAGFEMLRDAGIVKLSLLPESSKGANLIQMTLNNQYRVIYDVLDGLNWIDASVEENLQYFRSNIRTDFYFKRSFHKSIAEYAPPDCKVFPLGLNYFIKSRRMPHHSQKERLKSFIKNNRIISDILSLNKDAYYADDFEFYPILWKTNKILFLTRLWDPSEAVGDEQRDFYEHINAMRADCIRICRKEFGKLFTGGLCEDHFSVNYAKDLVLPSNLYKKQHFLQQVKLSNICVATTGLHNSTGWKFAEYLAASRAIVSEPLHFEVPGNLSESIHYYTFEHVTELVEKIVLLLENKDLMQQMMMANFRYYQNYLRPDMLVLNTLRTIN